VISGGGAVVAGGTIQADRKVIPKARTKKIRFIRSPYFVKFCQEKDDKTPGKFRPMHLQVGYSPQYNSKMEDANTTLRMEPGRDKGANSCPIQRFLVSLF
jgi:hypothetical protein